MKRCLFLTVICLFALVEASPTNNYDAPMASATPVIDGVADAMWNLAPWDSINYTWLNGTPPAPSDFSGRYKILWDVNRLYLLVEIVDDSLSDVTANPLDAYWDDDCVEIFLDENHNGGDHAANYSAFSYHVSTVFDVVDIGEDGQPHLYNDHITTARTRLGNTYLWEMSIKVFGEDYTYAGPNSPLTLALGKILGFTLAYCDNDGGSSRENFMGSVNTQGHIDNLGYQDASVFGTLHLVSAASSALVKSTRQSPENIAYKRFQVNGAKPRLGAKARGTYAH